MPFTQIPTLLTIYIVFGVIKMLNFFPSKGGVSAVLSPMTIMTGEMLDYKKHLHLPIGQYCQVHEEETPHNSQAPRTRGAIALGPSGNLQGGYKFMALNTGKKITRYSWDVIPMPDTVIARVNHLGRDQPEQLVFADRHGNVIGNNESAGVEPEYPPDNDEYQQPEAIDDASIPGVDVDVEIPGVDAGADDVNQAPQVKIHAPNANVPDDPAPIQVETVTDEHPLPDVAAPPPAVPAQPPEPIPAAPTGLRRST